jgi:hypothetical protein
LSAAARRGFVRGAEGGGRGTDQGNAIGGFKDFVERKYGAEGVEVLLRDAQPHDVSVFRGLILRAGWYPVGTWNRLSEAFVTNLAGGDVEAYNEMGVYVAEQDLNTIYKLLLKLASPTMLMPRLGWLWDRYFDFGKLETEQKDDRLFLVRLNAPTDVDAGLSRLTCSVGIPGWFQRAVVMTGATGAAVRHHACRFDGARCCEIDIAWR